VTGLQAECEMPTHGKMIVDKNPSLTLYIPDYLRLKPNAKVLISLRDPRDVAISCFSHNCPLNSVSATFLGFSRIARHYKSLMDAWLLVREWEGCDSLEVRYEDLISDVTKEGQRVCDYLRVEWDTGQQAFHAKAKTNKIFSPNRNTVTKPIYKSSLHRWHRYERYFAKDLIPLEPYCKQFGY
jgi:hypothetical protein